MTNRWRSCITALGLGTLVVFALGSSAKPKECKQLMSIISADNQQITALDMKKDVTDAQLIPDLRKVSATEDKLASDLAAAPLKTPELVSLSTAYQAAAKDNSKAATDDADNREKLQKAAAARKANLATEKTIWGKIVARCNAAPWVCYKFASLTDPDCSTTDSQTCLRRLQDFTDSLNKLDISDTALKQDQEDLVKQLNELLTDLKATVDAEATMKSNDDAVTAAVAKLNTLDQSIATSCGATVVKN
jgi:hypothetical protein